MAARRKYKTSKGRYYYATLAEHRRRPASKRGTPVYRKRKKGYHAAPVIQSAKARARKKYSKR